MNEDHFQLTWLAKAGPSSSWRISQHRPGRRSRSHLTPKKAHSQINCINNKEYQIYFWVIPTRKPSFGDFIFSALAHNGCWLVLWSHNLTLIDTIWLIYYLNNWFDRLHCCQLGYSDEQKINRLNVIKQLGLITLHSRLKMIITFSHVHYYTLNSNHSLTELFVLLFIFSYPDISFVLRPSSSIGIM